MPTYVPYAPGAVVNGSTVTTPVPTPTPFVLPQGVALNPVWDANISFGIPLWAWCLIAIIIFGVCFILIRWLYRASHMSAVSGYKDAAKSTDTEVQQVWSMGINGAFSIYCLTLKEKILTYMNSPILDKWLVPSSDCRGSCGGVPMMMVTGTSELVIDPPSVKAIVVICDEFNKNNALDENGNPNYVKVTDTLKDGTQVERIAYFDPTNPSLDVWTFDEDKGGVQKQMMIKSFKDYKFFLPMLERHYPAGVELPSWCYFDPSENQKYTDRKKTAEFFGARREKKARELYMQQHVDEGLMGFLKKNALVMFVMVFCVIVLIIAWQVAIS